MQKNKLKKAFALSMGLAVMTLLATNLNAQNGGGLFGRGEIANDMGFGNRNGGVEWVGGGMTPQDPTQEAPLGGGLMLLMAAGAGYAVLKRKEEQK